MNKIISSLAAVALLAMTVVIGPVQAASIASSTILVNDSATASIAVNTQITTVKFTPTTALVNGNTITIGYGANIVDASLVTGDIAVTDVTTDGTYSVSSADITANKITIAVTAIGASGADQIILTFSNSHFATPAAAAMLSFTVTTNSDIGANLIPVANYNQVSVSATVDPILTFSLADYNAGVGDDANINVQLGTVDTDASNAAEGSGKDGNVVTVATNAGSGITVKASDEALGLRTSSFAAARNAATNDGQINDVSVGAFPAAGTEAFGYQVGIGGAPAGSFNPLTGATPVTMNNFTGPTASGVVNVLYQAQTAATTAAGSYNDVITYTVTPTF